MGGVGGRGGWVGRKEKKMQRVSGGAEGAQAARCATRYCTVSSGHKRNASFPFRTTWSFILQSPRRVENGKVDLDAAITPLSHEMRRVASRCVYVQMGAVPPDPDVGATHDAHFLKILCHSNQKINLFPLICQSPGGSESLSLNA